MRSARPIKKLLTILRPNICKMKRHMCANTVRARSELKTHTMFISVPVIKKSTNWLKYWAAVANKQRQNSLFFHQSKFPDYFAERQEYILRGLQKIGSEWKCLICNSTYKKRNHAFNHVEAKHFQDDFIYSCPYCSSTFKTQNSYYVHLSTSHKEEHKMAKIWGNNK